MKFQIVIPPPLSASSSRLHSPKPQPHPAAAAAARPANIIAKRPRGRPPRKLRSKQEKLNAIARHLHAEYKWSLKDVIRHFVVDEPEEEGDASTTSAITTTTTTTTTSTHQKQQQSRVGALIDAIWGQPEVLRELEAHPAFHTSLRRPGIDDSEEGDVAVSRRAEEVENRGGGGVSSTGSAEEDEEGDEMSVDNRREASAEDVNEGQMSMEAGAANEDEKEMPVEASAEDQNEKKMSVAGSAEDEIDAEAISGSARDAVSAEEENPPISGHSYSTPEEEEESSEGTNNPTDSISSANILPSPHRTRGKKIDYISLAMTLPPDPDDDDENDADFALSGERK